MIVGGSFQGADGQAMHRIARWDGANWHPMGSGWAASMGGPVWTLTVTAGNELIAGGFCIELTQTGPSQKWQVVRWNRTDWEEFLPDFTLALDTPQVFALFPW